MVHFDAFDAFSADALVHFGSGIQVQGGGGQGPPCRNAYGHIIHSVIGDI